MHGLRTIVLAIAAVAAVAIACTSFESNSAPPEPPAADASPADDAAPADAAPDGPPCASNPIQALFTDGRWVFREAARAMPEGDCKLVTGQTNERGQAWWSEPHVADAFDASFYVAIGAGGGDGMAFSWVALDTVPSAGGPGGNVGICSSGNPGFGVIVDTSPVTPDTTPTIKLVDTRTANGCPDAPLAKAPIAAGSFPGRHKFKVTLKSSLVTVSFDDVVVLSKTLAGYTAPSSYFGFTAANGSVAASVSVSNAVLSFPSERPCP